MQHLVMKDKELHRYTDIKQLEYLPIDISKSGSKELVESEPNPPLLIIIIGNNVENISFSI